jgi:small-conductance mechanosensitive channel
MGRRIQDVQELAEAYDNWSELVEARARVALHKVLGEFMGFLGVLLGIFLLNTLIDRLTHRASQEKLRATTLSTLGKFGVRLVGVLIIIFLFFGIPSQITTVLGLAGAGLTVAMKDFIVAFFGWFVLMGKHGIRVGDWVEIKGVGGEVVEIGLMHTVLLETGSWTDAGHPTGRRVSFVNSFAIEGHYFNFSTSGQWMWDELSVAVPAGQDPYPIIEGIQKRVVEETEENARLAEKEWQQAASRYRVQSFSAVPGINVVPTSQGIEIRVRYITRAHERHETRRDLYAAVIELLHGKRE